MMQKIKAIQKIDSLWVVFLKKKKEFLSEKLVALSELKRDRDLNQ